MTIKEILQGKWLGHPAHPALAHVPLGLWLGACVLDVSIRAGLDDPLFSDLSMLAVAVGLAGALFAAPAGLADWSSIKRGKPAWSLGLYHLILNLAAIIVWAANLWIRVPLLDEIETVPDSVLILSITGAVILVVSGYLGSLMTFDQGTSVGRLSKGHLRSEAEHGGARLPEKH